LTSTTERAFAHDCSVEERVKLFFKLPRQFKIPTPLGTYNPDWALVFQGDSRVYFVAETKSSTLDLNLRRNERLNIACGMKHFDLSKDVVFKKVTVLKELLSAVP
jgi:type III restriction enzyme